VAYNDLPPPMMVSLVPVSITFIEPGPVDVPIIRLPEPLDEIVSVPPEKIGSLLPEITIVDWPPALAIMVPPLALEVTLEVPPTSISLFDAPGVVSVTVLVPPDATNVAFPDTLYVPPPDPPRISAPDPALTVTGDDELSTMI